MTNKGGSNNDQTWPELLRESIRSSDLTQYAICQAAGIERSMLARFMQGGGISLATAERIGRVLDVELAAPKKRGKKG